MAKEVKRTGKAKKDTKVKKNKDNFLMKNPTKTIWGKVLIIVLSAAMIIGTIGSLIWVIVDQLSKV